MKFTFNSNLKGVVYMIAASTVFAMKDGFAKQLTELYPVIELLSAQYTVQVIIFFPLIVWLKGWHHLLTSQLVLQVTRGLIGVIAVAFFYISIRSIPLADATALVFISPIIIAGLSPLILGEKVGVRRWLAVVAGFIGILLIVRPGFQEISIGTLSAVGAGCFYALFQIVTRYLSSKETPMVTAFYTSLVGAVISNVIIPFYWITPEATHSAMLIIIGILVAGGQLFLILSLVAAEAAVVAPFGYFAIVVATVIGYQVFGDIPALTTWIGMLIIVVSGIYIGVRETRAQNIQKRSLELKL